LAGGQSAIASVTSFASGTVSGVTGTLSNVSALASTLSTSALNQVSTATASLGGAAALLTGGSLTGAASKLLGGAAVAAAAASALGKLGGAAGALDALKNGVGGLTDMAKGLAAGKLGLSSLASMGLSGSASAALAASMNALSTSSPFPIKMPQVAIGTVDRSELVAAATKALGNPIIPAPNYAAPSSEELKAQLTRLENVQKLREDYSAAVEKFNAAFAIRHPEAKAKAAEYREAKANLPEGDPEREAIYARNKPIVNSFVIWEKDERAKLEAMRKAWLDAPTR
jgi:hypothetical protein